MKYEVLEPKTIEIKTVRLYVPVDDDEMPQDFPFRSGNMWKLDIDIDTGTILKWPQGVSGVVHLKPVDSGSYFLIDNKGKVVASLEQDYVPNGLIPGDYGDYIKLAILADGRIENWGTDHELDAFFPDDS